MMRRCLLYMALGGFILLAAGVWWQGGPFRAAPRKALVKAVDEQVLTVMQGMLEAWKGTTREVT